MSKATMPIDNYESVTKSKARVKFLQEAFADHSPENVINFFHQRTQKGGQIYAEYDREVYPTLTDLMTEIRTTSIARRKAQREESAQ